MAFEKKIMPTPFYTITPRSIDLVAKIADIFTDNLTKTELEFLEQIAGYLDKNREITNYRAQLLTNKSDVSVKKYFAKFVEIGILKKL